MARRNFSGSRAGGPFFSRRELADAAAGSIDRAVRIGAGDYDRTRHLPRLIPVDPAMLADVSEAGRRVILARLARALRAERNRGRAGHWTYDLNRHIGLKQAYTAEKAGAAAIVRPRP